MIVVSRDWDGFISPRASQEGPWKLEFSNPGGLKSIPWFSQKSSEQPEACDLASDRPCLCTTWNGFCSVQFSSVAQSCPALCDPMNRSTPGLPVHHQLLEFTQTHVHWVRDAIQPSHPLSSPSPPALNLSQYQGLFQWVSSLQQVAKVLEFQLQHQSYQWTPRTDLL